MLEDSDFELQPLPSDEAWFGEPDPSIYAAGTNDLTKEQLAQEVAKGNVCTLRQLKSHLLTATEDELAVSSADLASRPWIFARGCRGTASSVGTWGHAANRERVPTLQTGTWEATALAQLSWLQQQQRQMMWHQQSSVQHLLE